MSRIFVVGPCPYWAMPEGIPANAKNQRVWQLLQPLIADGHEICLCITDINNSMPNIKENLPGFNYQVISTSALRWQSRLINICKSFDPDFILSVMWYNGILSLCLPSKIPLWVDLFGYLFGEFQVAYNRNKVNKISLSTIAFNSRLMQRCDVLSTCSQRQVYAVISELGMTGRLNRHTLGYSFVHPISPGVAQPPFEALVSKLQSKKIGQEQIRLLWIGGYNAWTDVDVLFKGLTLALQACPSLVFVSTGGPTEGVDMHSYQRLLNHILASPLRERFHMLGWVSPERLYEEMANADIGLVIDAMHYETLLGTRTRLVDMMSKGIPVVTTLGCELSYIIRDHHAGVTCLSGDAKELSEAILVLARDAHTRTIISQNALDLMGTELSVSVTTNPLREWAKHPEIAPDRIEMNRLGLLNSFEMNLRKYAKLFLWDVFGRI